MKNLKIKFKGKAAGEIKVSGDLVAQSPKINFDDSPTFKSKQKVKFSETIVS